jgi:hypothetical protein
VTGPRACRGRGRGLLLPAVAVFAARSRQRGWPWHDRCCLAIAYGIGLALSLGGFVGLTAMPLLVLATSVALLERGPFGPRPAPLPVDPTG